CMSLFRNHRAAALLALNCLIAGGLLGAGAVGLQRLQAHTAAASTSSSARKGPMLLAPLGGGNDSCIEQAKASPAPALAPTGNADDLAASCGGAQGSAAALIESTLTQLAPAGTATSPYALGYTLAVPLLALFKQAPDGWEI